MRADEARDARYHRCSSKQCSGLTRYQILTVDRLHQCGICANIMEMCDHLLRDPYKGDRRLRSNYKDLE